MITHPCHPAASCVVSTSTVQDAIQGVVVLVTGYARNDEVGRGPPQDPLRRCTGQPWVLRPSCCEAGLTVPGAALWMVSASRKGHEDRPALGVMDRHVDEPMNDLVLRVAE